MVAQPAQWVPPILQGEPHRPEDIRKHVGHRAENARTRHTKRYKDRCPANQHVNLNFNFQVDIAIWYAFWYTHSLTAPGSIRSNNPQIVKSGVFHLEPCWVSHVASATLLMPDETLQATSLLPGQARFWEVSGLQRRASSRTLCTFRAWDDQFLAPQGTNYILLPQQQISTVEPWYWWSYWIYGFFRWILGGISY